MSGDHKKRNIGIGTIASAIILIAGAILLIPQAIPPEPTIVINGPESADVGDTVKFYGDDSFVPNNRGTITEYVWHVNDVEKSTEPSLEFEITEDQDYKIVLFVKDDNGNDKSEDKILKINSPDDDPEISKLVTTPGFNSPNNGKIFYLDPEKFNQSHVRLSWSSLNAVDNIWKNISHYEIKIDGEILNHSLIENRLDHTFEDIGPHTWQVRTVDKDGKPSKWSPEYKIIIKNSESNPTEIIENDSSVKISDAKNPFDKDELGSIVDITLDNENNIYLLDSSLHQIHKFSPTFEKLWSVGSEGNDIEQFKAPTHIAIDDENNIYVTDSAQHKIKKFDSSGNPIEWTGSENRLNGSRGLVIDSSSNLYVCTSGGYYSIQKISQEGNETISWKIPTCNYPIGHNMVIDSQDRIYVLDEHNRKVLVFDTKGNEIGSFGGGGEGHGQMRSIDSITIDGSDNIYVYDSKQKVIHIFKFDGDSGCFVQKIDETGKLIWSKILGDNKIYSKLSGDDLMVFSLSVPSSLTC